MAKITVTPMLGNPRNDRTESLRGCHAMIERSEYINSMPGQLGTSLDSAIKKLLLTDYVRENLNRDHKVSLIITLEV